MKLLIAILLLSFVYIIGWYQLHGQFINQLAQLAQQNQNFMVLLTASLYNPNVASGVWLDALCAFNGIIRNPATYSLVTCVCYGSATTVIPAGTLIQNNNNNVFYSTTDATIGNDGTVDVIFEAVESGAIPVDAGTVNNIITQVYGCFCSPECGVAYLMEENITTQLQIIKFMF